MLQINQLLMTLMLEILQPIVLLIRFRWNRDRHCYINITVTGVNDVPTAADKTITTNEDTAHVFSASDFGYTDADDDDALVSVKITGLEDAGALQYYNGSAWVDVTENQVITATDIAVNNLRFNQLQMKMDLLTLLLILQ